MRRVFIEELVISLISMLTVLSCARAIELSLEVNIIYFTSA